MGASPTGEGKCISKGQEINLGGLSTKHMVQKSNSWKMFLRGLMPSILGKVVQIKLPGDRCCLRRRW